MDRPVDITAEINARLASSVKVEAAKLRKLFSQTIPIKIDIKKQAVANIKTATSALKDINLQLIAINVNSKAVSNNLANLSQAFSKIGGGATKLNQTTQATQKAAKATKEATDQIAEFGRVSGLALRRNAGFIVATTAVYGLGRAITSSFSEAVRFEKELVKVAQVSNRSVTSLGPLVDEITRLSKSLGVASADLIDISLILAQAGLSANETRQALDVLAKTTLAATFGDIRDTTEGAIALMSQFGISAKDLSKALGATNAVAAAFAVESEDIIAAVKRAGGVFAQTSAGVTEGLDAFNQFIAVFSAVRATTRESAESIATGLRTIFTRIQRPQTIAFLQELGIELTDLEGKFVGPFEAVERLSKGLNGVDRRGSTFARVSEELGGFRQIGKTLALLASSEQRIKALSVAQEGQNSINKDAEQAQISLANAITRTQESFAALIREIAQTGTFDTMVRAALGLANAMIKVADSIKPVIPLIAALGAAKGLNFAARFFPAFKRGLGVKLASGGRVTGGKGGIDDIPAMLTAGEFVINKRSAKKIGQKNLEELNRIGFAKGGPVGFQGGGKVKPQLVPTENFIGSKVKEIPIEVTLVVRDVNGVPINTKTHSAANGSELVGQIGGNQQSDLTNTGRRNQFSPLRFTQIQTSERQAVIDRNERRKAENRAFNRRQDLEHSRQLERREQQVELGRRATIARIGDRNSAFASRSTGPNITNNQIARILQADTSNRFGFRQGDAFGNGALTAQMLREEELARLQPSPTARVSRPSFFSRFRRGASVATPVDQFAAFRGSTTPTQTGTTSRLRLGPGALGGAAVGVGLAASTLIGGETGNTLNSIIGGAGVGAALGGPVGAVVGGVAAAFNSFLQQGFDARMKKASDNMIASIDRVENSINEFDKDVKRGKPVEDALKKLSQESKGSVTSTINTLRAEQGKGLVFVDEISGTTRGPLNVDSDVFAGQSVEAARTQIQRGATGTQKFLFGLGGGSRQALGQGEDEIIASFNTAQTQAAKLSQAAELALNTRLERGVDFDTAFNRLSTEEQINLAIGRAKTRSEKLALGQALNTQDEVIRNADGTETPINRAEIFSRAVARSQILGGRSRVEEGERLKANKLQREAAESLTKVNSETDLFAEKLLNLSAVLERASEVGEGFKRQNEALLSRRSGGAGIVSQTRQNVFSNLRGFTQAEVARETTQLNTILGNSANSRRFTGIGLANKQLESGLPAVLNQLSKRVSISGAQEGRTLLPALINQNFSTLPEVLRNKLVSDIDRQFFANEQASPNDIAQTLAGGEASKISNQITGESVQALEKLTDIINTNISDFENALNTWVGLVNEANQTEDRRRQVIIDSINVEKQILGRERLSLANRTAGFTGQLSAFAGRAGSGTSLGELIATERNLNAARLGPQRGSPDEIARNLAQLANQQKNAQNALELIASNTDRQAALQEDLNSLIDSRKAARQIFEDFAFGSPEDRRTIERQIGLARTQAGGGQVLSSQLADAREGQRLLSVLTGAIQGPDAAQRLDQRFIGALDRSDAGRLFGIAGLNPGVGVGGLLNNRDAVFQGQFRQLQNANRDQAAAAGALVDINQRDANEFLANAQGQFNSVQAGLQQALARGGLFDRLNETLSQLPSEIAIGGQIRVDLNILGGERLAGLLPLINNTIAAEVERQIGAVIPREGASSRFGGVQR